MRHKKNNVIFCDPCYSINSYLNPSLFRPTESLTASERLMAETVASSSAVAERPRDALCPSLVNFNSNTLRSVFYYYIFFIYLSFTVIIYFGFRFTTAYNQMLLRCLRRNVEASCHKHFVVVFRHQQTPPLTSD